MNKRGIKQISTFQLSFAKYMRIKNTLGTIIPGRYYYTSCKKPPKSRTHYYYVLLHIIKLLNSFNRKGYRFSGLQKLILIGLIECSLKVYRNQI